MRVGDLIEDEHNAVGSQFFDRRQGKRVCFQIESLVHRVGQAGVGQRLPGMDVLEEGSRARLGGLVEDQARDRAWRIGQTRTVICHRLICPGTVDERLIEPWNHFEGTTFGVGDGALRRPANWPHLRNPFRPSWGEPYQDVAARMLAMMETARKAAGGQEALCVSHQLPIWVTRRMAERKRLWHNPATRECALGSVTSFTYRDGVITGVSYTEPAGRGRAQIPGA